MELKCLHQITSTSTLFCHPIHHNRPPLFLVSSPPNYQHELIVASDGWRSARELPVSHHHPIIVVVEASSSCRAASACCPLPSSCHPSPSSCRVVMPPVAIVVPPVTLPPLGRRVTHRRRRAARRRRRAACHSAAPCRRPSCRPSSCRPSPSSCRPLPLSCRLSPCCSLPVLPVAHTERRKKAFFLLGFIFAVTSWHARQNFARQRPAHAQAATEPAEAFVSHAVVLSLFWGGAGGLVED